MSFGGGIEVKRNEKEEIIRKGKEPKKRKRRKVFWGLILIAGALIMLLGRLGLFDGVNLFEGVGFWQLLFSVLLAAIFVNGIVRRSFGQILFSLAFLIILNDELLHLEAITPWPVLLAALVMTVGLKLLFPGFRSRLKWNIDWSTSKLPPRSEWTEGAVSYDNFLGSSVKYLSGEITEVYLKNGFGELEVYFNECRLKDGNGRIYLGSSFGSMGLFVPADWQVILNVDSAFGEVTEVGSKNPSGRDRLYIDGEVAFGELVIHYIQQEVRNETTDSTQGISRREYKFGSGDQEERV